MSKPEALCVIGTRPEAIKMAPLIIALRNSGWNPVVLATGQHSIAEYLGYFGLYINCELPHQYNPIDCTVQTMRAIKEIITRATCVIAQGDTTSVFAAASAAFMMGKYFVHVEAGLRTYNLEAPYPEECYRRCVSLMTTLHCAPTKKAKLFLGQEGYCDKSIQVTGNTGIDALRHVLDKREVLEDAIAGDYVLLTSHRLENRVRQTQIADAVRQISQVHRVVYVKHQNEKAHLPVERSSKYNIEIKEPQSYPEMVALLADCKAIMTDSGGLQEEACYLRKPTIVLRECTEREEAVQYGTAFLAGVGTDDIVDTFDRALKRVGKDGLIANDDPCPYGEGDAAHRIVKFMERLK